MRSLLVLTLVSASLVGCFGRPVVTPAPANAVAEDPTPAGPAAPAVVEVSEAPEAPEVPEVPEVPEAPEAPEAPDGPKPEATIRNDAPIGTWRLVRLSDEAVTREITLNVEKNGRIGGRSACNSFGGNWTAGEAGSRIGRIVATRRACARPLMELERNYLSALRRAAGWTAGEGGISLVDADGRELLAFAAAR